MVPSSPPLTPPRNSRSISPSPSPSLSLQNPLPSPSPPSTPRPRSTTSPPPTTHTSTTWTPRSDALLASARARRLNWHAIARQHFPCKTANACRKRHERLMVDRNGHSNGRRKRPGVHNGIAGTDDAWDAVRLEQIAARYLTVRREMWRMVADAAGERWMDVEAKCFELGIKGLTAAARSTRGPCAHDPTTSRPTPAPDVEEHDQQHQHRYRDSRSPKGEHEPEAQHQHQHQYEHTHERTPNRIYDHEYDSGLGSELHESILAAVPAEVGYSSNSVDKMALLADLAAWQERRGVDLGGSGRMDGANDCVEDSTVKRQYFADTHAVVVQSRTVKRHARYVASIEALLTSPRTV